MKNLWWSVGVVVVLIFAFLWLLNPTTENSNATGNNTGNNISTTTLDVKKSTKTNTVPNSTKTTPKSSELSSIFPQKGNYECNYEEVTSSQRSTNVIYFSDGKMRAEFRTLGGSSNLMVYDGVYMYNWIEGQSKGILSQPKSISDFPAIIPKDITDGRVLGSGLNSASWYCHAWSKDASLLAKPSYLSF